MFNFSFSDVAPILDPWTAIASGTLLIQYYQSPLTRLGYIALLFYWYVYISNNYHFFSQILSELLRSKWASCGERDFAGRHWTLNIADHIVLAVFNQIFTFFLPNYFWTLIGFNIFLSLFFLGHYVVRLWMQTQIARLVRLNTNAWRWRDWVIDSTFLSLTQNIDSPATRAIAKACWWTLHQVATVLTSEVIINLALSYSMLPLLLPSNPYTKSLVRCSNCLIFYLFWFRHLRKFANPNPPEHKHTPLKNPEDIRVILLYPRFGFKKIYCSLLQGPHMQILIYEDISYNWGSADTIEEILVDGCKKKVTKSVYEILASYSSLFLPKLLWIDALCIDQENDAEKSQQVPLMGKIYLNALFTTVFLGRSSLHDDQGAPSRSLIPYRYDGIRPNNKNTQSHFEDARLTSDLLREFHVLQEVLRDPEMEIYKFFEYLKLSKPKQRQWAAFLKMLQHPWFERVWVIQEVAISTEVEVKYGDEVIDWDLLANGVKKLNNARHFKLWLELEHGVQLLHIEHTSLYNIARMHQFRGEYRLRGLYDLIYDSLGPRKALGLCVVLAESVYFKATNPRDLIFGLMSLCVHPLKVDYALSVEDVYLSAAKRLINDETIHLLLHTSGVGNRLESKPIASKLPSWVPDWTATPKYKRLQNAVNWGRETEFKAGGEGKPAINLKYDRTLAVSGYRVDIIEELGPALFDTSHQSNRGTIYETHQFAVNYETCLDLLTESSHTLDPYPHAAAGQSLLEAFRRTLFIDRTWIGRNQSAASFLEMFPQWEESLKFFYHQAPAQLSMNKDDIYKLLKSMDEVTEDIKSCCGRRRFFITRKGYIGMCPPYAKQEDLIYIVPGVHVPIQARLKSTNPGSI